MCERVCERVCMCVHEYICMCVCMRGVHHLVLHVTQIISTAMHKHEKAQQRRTHTHTHTEQSRAEHRRHVSIQFRCLETKERKQIFISFIICANLTVTLLAQCNAYSLQTLPVAC